jgi:hypothetical protein
MRWSGKREEQQSLNAQFVIGNGTSSLNTTATTARDAEEKIIRRLEESEETRLSSHVSNPHQSLPTPSLHLNSSLLMSHIFIPQAPCLSHVHKFGPLAWI